MSHITSIFTDLVRVETRLYNTVNARLRTEQDLSLGQFEFLEIIDRVPECRVLDIVGELAITVGAVSKAVDRLVAAGWCVRVAHPRTAARPSFASRPRARNNWPPPVPSSPANSPRSRRPFPLTS